MHTAATMADAIPEETPTPIYVQQAHRNDNSNCYYDCSYPIRLRRLRVVWKASIDGSKQRAGQTRDVFHQARLGWFFSIRQFRLCAEIMSVLIHYKGQDGATHICKLRRMSCTAYTTVLCYDYRQRKDI